MSDPYGKQNWDLSSKWQTLRARYGIRLESDAFQSDFLHRSTKLVEYRIWEYSRAEAIGAVNLILYCIVLSSKSHDEAGVNLNRVKLRNYVDAREWYLC